MVPKSSHVTAPSARWSSPLRSSALWQEGPQQRRKAKLQGFKDWLLNGPKLDNDDPFFEALKRDPNDTGKDFEFESALKGNLLNTNAVSELRRPLRLKKVDDLIKNQPLSSLYTSVLTVGELRKGFVKLQRKEEIRSANLASWIDGVISFYGERILPVNMQIAMQWAQISAVRTFPTIDTLLAATAIVHDRTLVTRNTKDFTDTGVKILNPLT